MVSRSEARRRAVEILFEADVRDRPASDVLAAHREGGDPPATFTAELVLGVHQQQAALDVRLGELARDWSIARMPIVDRTILRLGLYELHHTPTPPAVVLSQAVELAGELSTDDSARYVNGVLGAAAEALTTERG